LIPEAAGKEAGYSRGGDFTKITEVCSADNQSTGDALEAGAECKIDIGDDLVIWTKHFTRFVSYTQTEIIDVAPTGGGGFIPATSCASVEYDEWQNTCIDGWQYRDVLSLTPANCALTVEQESGGKRICVKDKEKSNNILEENKEEENKDEEEVLDVETENLNTPQPAEDTVDIGIVYFSDVKLIIADVGVKRDLVKEKEGVSKYTKPLIRDVGELSSEHVNAITNFVVYGTKNTEKLGAGERAGVLNSYKSIFSKLPTTQIEWEDVIKISSGTLPNETNSKAEDKAKKEFKKVYQREVSMENSNDKTAINKIAYGLRPEQRDLDSERAGIRSFVEIYNYLPTSAIDWDTVRAIAYSGAI